MRPHSTALIRATIGVIWLVVGMTILTEISAPFKNLLVELAGHHWAAKSLIAALAFALLYLIFRKTQESDNILRGVWYVIGSVVLGGLIIFSFYLWHFLST
jgi:hypothetical protein